MIAKPKKIAKLGMVLEPIQQVLPYNVAAMVGKTINRFALIEVTQQHIFAGLLGISIKQVRVVIRISRPGVFIQAIKLLIEFLELNVSTKWSTLRKALDKADSARNALAHSIFLRSKGTKILKIQLTSSTWDLGHEYEPVSRMLIPEGKLADMKFLREQREHVEIALKMTQKLERQIERELRALNKKRQSTPSLDRRRHS